MSKLNYPEDGLTPRTKTIIEDCSTFISNAAADCYFDIPWRFAHRDYLNRLGGTINGYRDKLNSIRSEINKADYDFNSASERAVSNINKIEIPKITERKRRVV
jgi:hypothetical protein